MVTIFQRATGGHQRKSGFDVIGFLMCQLAVRFTFLSSLPHYILYWGCCLCWFPSASRDSSLPLEGVEGQMESVMKSDNFSAFSEISPKKNADLIVLQYEKNHLKPQETDIFKLIRGKKQKKKTYLGT